jgi:hypothetical protein
MRWFSRSVVRTKFASRQFVRARRHRLSLPLHYRFAPDESVTVPECEWHSGMVRDVSATGALLELESARIKPGDHLELRLTLPSQWVGPAQVPVLCNTKVVRVEKAGGNHIRVAVALQRGAVIAQRNGHSLLVPEPVPDIQHTINNLLTSIVGTSELLLLNDSINAAERTQLNTIRNFALRAARELRRLKDPAA